jgi:hypothetical protein
MIVWAFLLAFRLAVCMRRPWWASGSRSSNGNQAEKRQGLAWQPRAATMLGQERGRGLVGLPACRDTLRQAE